MLLPALLVACGQVPATSPLPSASATASEPSGSPSAVPRVSASAAPSASASRAAGTENCEYVASGTAARPVKQPRATGVPARGTVTYVLTMTEGNVAITLDRAKAPCTAHSFASLAEQGFYDQTRCHRLVDSGLFILQCGDPTGTGQGGPGYTFADETDGTESYRPGVVAMANAGPNTNGSQFFLVYDDSSGLDPKYTIFGRMDDRSRGVVERMAFEGQDGSNPAGGGKPNNPAEIIRVRQR